SRLRIYRQNKGNMLELVRYQKEKLPKAASAEEMVLSSSQVMRKAGELRKEYGNLVDIPTYSIPYPQIRKIAAIRNHLWGL
ncbi:MAG: ISLre2 family transposase, partial [Lachnospiraceae bacterium]|nr:ISLre2 family transposase [Lachnospiraceae bacterium]